MWFHLRVRLERDGGASSSSFILTLVDLLRYQGPLRLAPPKTQPVSFPPSHHLNLCPLTEGVHHLDKGGVNRGIRGVPCHEKDQQAREKTGVYLKTSSVHLVEQYASYPSTNSIYFPLQHTHKTNTSNSSGTKAFKDYFKDLDTLATTDLEKLQVRSLEGGSTDTSTRDSVSRDVLQVEPLGTRCFSFQYHIENSELGAEGMKARKAT